MREQLPPSADEPDLFRFIPAYAGNTRRHPRADQCQRSSPRIRGTRPPAAKPTFDFRFIPAYAGTLFLKAAEFIGHFIRGFCLPIFLRSNPLPQRSSAWGKKSLILRHEGPKCLSGFTGLPDAASRPLRHRGACPDRRSSTAVLAHAIKRHALLPLRPGCTNSIDRGGVVGDGQGDRSDAPLPQASDSGRKFR